MRTLFKRVRRELEDELASAEESLDELEPTPIENPEKEDESGRISQIPLELLSANPAQPRTSFEDEALLRLADSIRQHGILQPLTVRRRADGFELIAGERRFRAAKLLELECVPCIIIEADDRRSAELALIENLQRENLNFFEQASSIAALIDLHGLTQDEAARRLAVSQSFVANKLRILRMSAREREAILSSGLTERHARALLRLDSVDERLRAIAYIAAHELNVASTEAYIERLCTPPEPPRAPRKIILKDIRLFYNSIDRAMSLVRQAGIEVDRSISEGEDESVLTIRIRKNVSRETLQSRSSK